jgi:hypothetical protein
MTGPASPAEVAVVRVCDHPECDEIARVYVDVPDLGVQQLPVWFKRCRRWDTWTSFQPLEFEVVP